MNPDTQWPRYQVFVQARKGAPFMDAGSVHAPDAELALFNARDVFARRPECYAMWVAPVEAIVSRSADELERGGDVDRQIDPAVDPSAETYQVFCKARPAATVVWVGTLQAASPGDALQSAARQFSGGQKATLWWAIPDSMITRSQADDFESLYQPADSKHFRLSTDFQTISTMRKIMAARSLPTPTDPDQGLSEASP
jgi:ring-1,2-phenylacetyl-CoA epoxidase subunit PaaB